MLMQEKKVVMEIINEMGTVDGEQVRLLKIFKKHNKHETKYLDKLIILCDTFDYMTSDYRKSKLWSGYEAKKEGFEEASEVILGLINDNIRRVVNTKASRGMMINALADLDTNRKIIERLTVWVLMVAEAEEKEDRVILHPVEVDSDYINCVKFLRTEKELAEEYLPPCEQV